ncbi:MAG: VOC family protein [Actinomycetia bacterium]|nr:VOC family protein [Actinomycetes bacterium]
MARLTVVSLVVSNLAASIDFYSRLGLTLSEGDPDDDHAELLGAGVRVMLDTEDLTRQLHAGWTRPTGGHAMALAFECGSPEEVDSTFDLLIKTGRVSVQEPWNAFWGQRYATVADPDGNPVDLFCPL